METLVALLKADPNAANAFGALASAATAFFALFVSCVSVWITFAMAKAQRQHNQLSVRPLAEVMVADYENSLWVKIRNNGCGPMITTEVTVSRGSSTKNSIIDWMPLLAGARPWTTFSHTLQGRTLQPGAELILIELTAFDGERNFAEHRASVRSALASLNVRVEYKDIYEAARPPTQKALLWFGRHDNT